MTPTEALLKTIRQTEREGLMKDPCSHSAMTKLIAKFEKTSNVLNECQGRPSLQEKYERAVEGAVVDSGGKTFVNRISTETNIPRYSVQPILKDKI